MKNRAGFYTRSSACNEAINSGCEAIAFRCSESAARSLGVEWHHGGSGIIAFFPESDSERERVLELKNGRKIKSKAAAIRYLESTSGNYKIPYKLGKYGKFFNFWGDPDGYLSIDENDPNLPEILEVLC